MIGNALFCIFHFVRGQIIGIIILIEYNCFVIFSSTLAEALFIIGELIETVEYDYPDFHLSMDCFWCEVVEGDLVLLEAQEARWLTKEELGSVKWLPADLGLIERIRAQMR